MKIKLPKAYKQDMKKAYEHFTKEKWKATKPLCQCWQTAWEMCRDSLVSKEMVGYYNPSYYEDNEIVGDWDDYDPHIGCYSYPMCDIDTNGCCVVNGADAEPYGHRD